MVYITLVYLVFQSICDIRERNISLCAAASYVGVIFVFVRIAGWEIDIMPVSFWTAGALAAFSLLSGGAFGMGDAIVIGTLAFTHRPDELLMLLLVSLMFCFPAAIVLMFKNRHKEDRALPFVPFLLAGELAGLAAQRYCT